MDLNKAQVIGRLTADPEVRTTASGTSVANFSVATNFVWTDASGEKKETVEFHNVVAWRKLGEIIGKYLKKGSRIFIEGRLQTRSWEGQDGVKRYRTEIIADNMIMLDSKGGASPAARPPAEEESIQIEETPTTRTAKEDLPSEAPRGGTKKEEEEISVEDIPF